MTTVAFDALTRRASLMSLGVVGLASIFAMPSNASAKKKHGKKKGKKSDANDLKRCKQQAAAWTSLVTTECADPAGCPDELACATQLKSCDFGGFLACFTAAGQSMSRSTAGGTGRIAAHHPRAGMKQKRSS